MQTFLPYADFSASSAVLDDRRLGKQRVETFQILRALTWPAYAWKNHPAVRMWRGFVPALVAYGLANCDEWSRRGYADTVSGSLLEFSGGTRPSVAALAEEGQLPPWLGLDVLHLSHQSSLVRKEPEWYRPLFPDVPDDLPYYWPPDLFPRWPVRTAGQPTTLDEALQLLGHDDVRAGQAEAVAAVSGGRDCLAVLRPGTGGSTAGLLAGLVMPGRTLWVSPDDGPRGRFAEAAELPLVEPREPVTRAAPGTGPVAKSPGPAEIAAMRAESSPAEWVFTRVHHLADHLARLSGSDIGLVVVDRGHELPPEAARSVGQARAILGGPPLLALTAALPEPRRTELAAALGLREPALTSGGWDVPATLDVLTVGTAPGRRVAELVLAYGPAVVLLPDRAAAAGMVSALRRAGQKVASLHPASGPGHANRASAAWRSRRLDALVATDEVPIAPLLGRVRPRSLIAVDVPASPLEWRDLVEQLGVDTAVAVAGPQAPPWLADWAASSGCRRSSLLGFFGAGADVPCGRCGACERGEGPLGA